MERLRVPPIREYIEQDVHINAILITLGMEIAFIIMSIIIIILLIIYGDLVIDYEVTINLFRYYYLL